MNHKGHKDHKEHQTQRVSSLCPSCALWFPSLWFVIAAFLITPLDAQFLEKPTRPQVEAPKGPVRQVIFKHCTSCHGIDDYAYNALDATGWRGLLDTKHK